jgi:hypothetical protein
MSSDDNNINPIINMDMNRMMEHFGPILQDPNMMSMMGGLLRNPNVLQVISNVNNSNDPLILTKFYNKLCMECVNHSTSLSL